MGTLYLVGTPIGNLGDLSPRGVEVLSQVDFIAAEDTRVTLKLLNHFDIKKPMISCHEHNIRQRGEEIVQRLLSGQTGAVVTDAGMPCISDPGEELVRLCHERGIRTEVVPGPSALIAALAVSGLSTARFAFEGFLPARSADRLKQLEKLSREERTLVFYEAPHKLLQTLEDMASVLGDRRVTLCRELTKLHEEVIPITLCQAVSRYRQTPPKGEFVLVVEGAAPEEDAVTLEDAVALVQALRRDGEPLAKAAKDVAAQTGYRKGELYKLALEAGEEQGRGGAAF